MPLLMACRRRATRSELSRPALSARIVGSCRSARAKASTAGPELVMHQNGGFLNIPSCFFPVVF